MRRTFNLNRMNPIERDLLSLIASHPKLAHQAPVNQDWFISKSSGIIYKAIISQMYQSSNTVAQSARTMTLCAELNHAGLNISLRSAEGLISYYQQHDTASSKLTPFQLIHSAKDLAHLVHNQYLRRQLEHSLRDYSISRYTDEGAWEQVIQYKRQLDLLNSNQLTKSSLVSATQAVRKSLTNNTSHVIKMSKTFDQLVGNGGLTPKSITVLGACSGVGKTTLLLDLSLDALNRNPKLHIDYFTLEMDANELVQKMVPYMAFHNYYVSHKHFHDRQAAHDNTINMYVMTHNPCQVFTRMSKAGHAKQATKFNAQAQRYLRKLEQLGQANRFDPISGTDFDSIVYQIKQDSLKYHDHYLAIIDHIGLITLSGYVQRIDIDPRLKTQYVTRHLKQVAIQTNAPLIEASELNRSVDKWSKPETSSLMDSSSVETDSNNILFMYRIREGRPEYKTIRCLYCAKSRMGETGLSKMFHFDGDHGCFIPLSHAERQFINTRIAQKKQQP